MERLTRRAWMEGLLQRSLGFAAAQLEERLERRLPPQRRPPGAESEALFLAACTRCGECVRACPHGAIHVFEPGSSLLAKTPVLVPDERPCHECEGFPCAAACPEPALQIPESGPWRLGRVRLVSERCLAWAGPECGACIGVCPAGAVALRLENWRPILDSATCVGCGRCIERCPMIPEALELEPLARDSAPERPASASRSASSRLGVAIALLLTAFLSIDTVAAQPSDTADASLGSRAESLWHNSLGRFALNARLRWEYADIDGFDPSNAVTLRTRLGFETKPWRGLSGFAEGAGSFAFNPGDYWDGTGGRTGDSIIADPGTLQLNRAWGRYRIESLSSEVKAGRSRWKLDDDRFIGNVGWRQNEQTYDSLRVETTLGQEKLRALYGFSWRIKRIWGDRSPSSRHDWRGGNHFAHLHYDFAPELGVSVFGYFLNLHNSDANSSNSYGLRFTGKRRFTKSGYVAYAASFAWQTDAANNPADYAAPYYALEAAPGLERFGSLGVGYEVLGSDGGKAQFRTPLATGHKFNGFADAFLDNGGSRGLRDLYAFVAPRLPWEARGKLIYHWFWSDRAGRRLGGELDLVVSRAWTKHLRTLAKAAFFDGRPRGPADRSRVWLQTELSF